MTDDAWDTEPPSWGARLDDEHQARFALWAPGQSEVLLRTGGTDRAMERAEDGWFRLVVRGLEERAPYSFILENGMAVPDPASRLQAGDVHGPSLLPGPDSYEWQTADWRGRPWEETVIYELHIGTFTPEGTFRAAIERLDHLAETGITAIEIMPVAQFAGDHGWGYDGVLLYAPHPAYGTPDDMKALVDAAHARGLMVFLDVVYNHFGPDGNYIGAYAPDFYHPERHTPWGMAIDYEKPAVRAFIIDNVLYWLKEFRLDGLRFDAIDHIKDEGSKEHILMAIARRVRETITDRPVHLTTEDNRNITRLHERGASGETGLFTGEWNDDFHNVAHVVATGENEAYYADFAEHPWEKFARALAEGFAYQGQTPPSGSGPRGVPSGHLPPTAFVDFIQNHDQIGNRAFGERLTDLAEAQMVRALATILLLSPHIPLLFMGEEWGETRPFAFFTDFHGDLADNVREGRRREFGQFSGFHDARSRAEIPDPNDAGTFQASKIDWDRAASDTGRDWLSFYRTLLQVRRREIVPFLAGSPAHSGTVVAFETGLIAVDWTLNGARLCLRANLGKDPRTIDVPAGHPVHACPFEARKHLEESGELTPCSVFVWLETENGKAS